MSLNSGFRLGPYEIHAALGAGGMGEVYRARDTRLDRAVAIKVLPADVADDAERRARFEREARAVAALSHPHICVIHDVGRDNGVDYLVMELLEGETLADRLARVKGPLPLEQVLKIGSEIADALDKAHRAGIVHRDLKPANIMLTKTGAKLLDFGLAKKREDIVAGSLSDVTTHAGTPGTAAGTLLGTVHYMAPEQVEGRDADARSDIWALGVVLYEMASGTRPFDGASAASLIGSILKDTPASLTTRESLTPAAFEHIVERCLEKDPEERWQSAGDIRRELIWGGVSRPATVTISPPAHASWSRLLPWVLAATASGLALVSMMRHTRADSISREHFVQVESRVTEDAAIVTQQGPAAVLSPDGSLLAFVARRPGRVRQLFTRRLNQLRTTPLLNTEDARIPFFSPDGQWIAFFANSKLKKVPAAGGDAVIICDAPNGRGGSWGDDGYIVFNPTAAGSTALLRVSANGGTPQPAFALDAAEATQRWPQVLPGSQAVIYSSSSNLGNYNDGQIVGRRVPDGARTVLVDGGYFARYLADGHLTYVHNGRLFAVPFDASRLAVTGSPVPVLEHVAVLVTTGAAHYDVSLNGTLAYLPGEEGSRQPLQWLTREGRIDAMPTPPMDWSNPRFSPDGRRIALDIFDGKQTDIHLYDWSRNVLERLTFDESEDWQPVWTPDGTRVAFRTTRRSLAFNIFSQRADGSGDAIRLTESRNPQFPASWLPSGGGLAYSENTPTSDNDVMLLPVNAAQGTASGAPKPLLNSPFGEVEPAISPDGNWVAYSSNQDGRYGVYVRPYPGPGPQRQVAAEGSEPVWSQSRNELLYLGSDQRVMVVPYSVQTGAFQAQPSTPWAPARAVPRPRGLAGFDGRAFDIHPDGNRLVGTWLAEDAPAPVQNTVALGFNFFEELKRLSPLAH